MYILSLDASFASFLLPNTTWLKKTRAAPLRGLVEDPEGAPNRRTAAQKAAQLDLMLGQIANFCPVISRNTITKNSTSIESIWQAIRAHYGFQSTGAHFLDLINIALKPDERPEDLFQRLMAFVEDSLLLPSCGLRHHNEDITEEEELSPTLENLVVLLWLHLINKDLPSLVKQKYGTELRSRTLASIKPEISQAMDSLLNSIQANDDARVMRTMSSKFQPRPNKSFTKPTCPLCSASRRPSNHYLSKCQFLPESDRKFIAKARLIGSLEDHECDTNSIDPEESVINQVSAVTLTPSTRRVQVSLSPTVDMFYKHNRLTVTLDTGAETNMIRESSVRKIGATIIKSNQLAFQADGKSPLHIKGETNLTLSYNNKQFTLNALVVESLDVEILAGMPFLNSNDITIRPAQNQVIFNDGSVQTYSNPSNRTDHKPPTISRTRAYVLKPPSTTVWPGDFIELSVPQDLEKEDLALEPRIESSDLCWPSPTITQAVEGKIRIFNDTSIPKVLKKNQQFAQVLRVADVSSTPQEINQQLYPTTTTNIPSDPTTSIEVDPDRQFPAAIRENFRLLHHQHASVFTRDFEGYNGATGPIKSTVNMGPTEPPQRKGKVPQYSKDKLVELQEKCDELERLGVLQKPEQVNVVPEYLNPSFLVKKPSGGHRLVTSFGEVARYSKPPPTLMPDVNNTLQSIGQWQYIIKTDLTQAYYQIPLDRKSMKYCGIVTPFKGVRVYTRSAMGMPGSETALEELLSRILGDLIQEGIIAKVADDLYCGGDTPDELFRNWERVLQKLSRNRLVLSAKKTMIAPKTTTVLGWIWSFGQLRASPHRISTLTSCSRPSTVKSLRSYLGAYKFISRVVPNCSSYLAPLERLVAGRSSSDIIEWSSESDDFFRASQDHLHNTGSITIPKPSDQLWLVTDGAVKYPGLGSTLYVQRNNDIEIAGYYSTKLKERQTDWIPCETEALSIAASIQHFSPFVVQSHHPTCVLTDSKPCVQAYARLLKGQFSHSSRVTTFLSVASRFHVQIQHLSGTSNIPSDFACRNAPECLEPRCQVCSFVNEMQCASVSKVNIDDISKGNSKMPFISRPTWISLQSDCPDLRRCHSHLKQGTRPSKKLTNIKDTKRYLQHCTISKDGLLVVPHREPFSPVKEKIVVPRKVLPGLLTALHVKLNHPTQFQLKQITSRYFFALDLDSSIRNINDNCHTCTSLKKMSNSPPPATTSDPPPTVGVSFASDVIRRFRQKILLVRETVTSYTSACIIDGEDHTELRNGLIRLCIGLRPLDGPPAIIRTDPAPGFNKLIDDPVLTDQRLSIEIGRVKNNNKNPVAEKAIQELEDELLKLDRDSKSVNESSLSIAVANLNSRVRASGLSSREMLTQRDQFTGEQLPLEDRKLISDQHHRRLATNLFNNQKAGNNSEPAIQEGAIVYIKSERNKTQSRPRYLVTLRDGPWYHLKKFSGDQLRNVTYKVHRNQLHSIPVPEIPSTSTTVEEEDVSPSLTINQTADEIPASAQQQELEAPPSLHPLEPPSVLVAPPDNSTDNEEVSPIPEESPIKSRPKRIRNPPKWMDDYVPY